MTLTTDQNTSATHGATAGSAAGISAGAVAGAPSSNGRGSDRFRRAQERLAPVFEHIAEGAVQREADRVIDHEAIRRLRHGGFTALRVPTEYGGSGLTFGEAAHLVVELAAADSNLTQALRAHLLHTEGVLAHPDADYRERWLRRLGRGDVVGNAITEVGNAVGTSGTRLSRDADGELWLNGTKFYSTGSLYADWILVSAVDASGQEVGATVRADARGVSRTDDWDGFGQQLTASGTTVFRDTPVDPVEVSERGLDNGSSAATGQALAQYVHLATLTGIGQAIVRDTSAYVRGRRRSFSHGAAELPRDDAQVLQVVGEISSAAFAAQAAFGTVVPLLEQLLERESAGQPAGQEEVDAVYVAVYQAQQVIAAQVLEAATRMFEVGGASATSQSRRLDRHWRNARVLASHNPLIYRARYIGDWEVNGTPPGRHYRVGSAPSDA